MTKEQRAEQLTILFAQALKGLEQGAIEDCVLIPFASDERVEVIRKKADGSQYTQTVNAPF